MPLPLSCSLAFCPACSLTHARAPNYNLITSIPLDSLACSPSGWYLTLSGCSLYFVAIDFSLFLPARSPEFSKKKADHIPPPIRSPFSILDFETKWRKCVRGSNILSPFLSPSVPYFLSPTHPYLCERECEGEKERGNGRETRASAPARAHEHTLAHTLFGRSPLDPLLSALAHFHSSADLSAKVWLTRQTS